MAEYFNAPVIGGQETVPPVTSKRKVRTREHWSNKLVNLPLMQDWLVEQKYMSDEQADECIAIAHEKGQEVTQVAIEKGYVMENSVLSYYSDVLDIDYLFNLEKATLSELDFDNTFFNKFASSILEEMHIIPLKYDMVDTSSSGLAMKYQVHIILNDPWKLLEIYTRVDDVFRTIYMTEASMGLRGMNSSLAFEVLTEEPQIEIVAYLAKKKNIIQVLAEIDNVEEQVFVYNREEAEAEKQIKDIIDKAIRFGVSDIHISTLSRRGGLCIRHRIDGDLEDIQRTVKYTPDEYKTLYNKMIILANLDQTHSMIPQSGSFQYTYEKTTYDIRIEVVPTMCNTKDVYGNCIVLRILYKNNAVSLDTLGLYPRDLALLKFMYERNTAGMMVATGPTSSGKSTTMYSILQTMDLKRNACYTIEDPVEYAIENAVQIPVSDAEGRSYPKMVRSMMRLDPNIIYIGEIRDDVSADSAVGLANTGHMVLSTLHTNSSFTVAQRLVDLGVEPFMLAQALTGVIAQRLVKKNCPHCTTQYKPEQRVVDLLELPSNIKYYKGSGVSETGGVCPYCKGKGTKGRMGIFELLPMYKFVGWERYAKDPTRLRDMFINAEKEEDRVIDLYGDAIRKMRDGFCSPDVLAGVVAPYQKDNAHLTL